MTLFVKHFYLNIYSTKWLLWLWAQVMFPWWGDDINLSSKQQPYISYFGQMSCRLFSFLSQVFKGRFKENSKFSYDHVILSPDWLIFILHKGLWLFDVIRGTVGLEHCVRECVVVSVDITSSEQSLRGCEPESGWQSWAESVAMWLVWRLTPWIITTMALQQVDKTKF